MARLEVEPNSPEAQAEIEEARDVTAKLFDSKRFCDVTFVVGGDEIIAHKSILSARYKSFETMITTSDERKLEKIQIKDMEPEVFDIMLEFIYKGQLFNAKKKLEDHAVELIQAAKTYGIPGLRQMCERHIVREERINVHNACDYFIMADENMAPHLMEASVQFISKHLEGVKKTLGYQALKHHRTSPAKVVEMLTPPNTKRSKLLE